MKKESILSKALRTSLLIPLALTSLVAISSVAYSHEDHDGCKQAHWDKAKQGEFFQKRQKELHDKLALTSTQESAWNSFVEKTKPNEMHKKEDWAEMSKLTTPERLDQMLARTKEREEQVEKRVQATKEFYNQLTSTQQKTFDASFQHREHHGHEGEDEHS
jgi:periplasmic protein CpxP/Spy